MSFYGKINTGQTQLVCWRWQPLSWQRPFIKIMFLGKGEYTDVEEGETLLPYLLIVVCSLWCSSGWLLGRTESGTVWHMACGNFPSVTPLPRSSQNGVWEPLRGCYAMEGSNKNLNFIFLFFCVVPLKGKCIWFFTALFNKKSSFTGVAVF